MEDKMSNNVKSDPEGRRSPDANANVLEDTRDEEKYEYGWIPGGLQEFRVKSLIEEKKSAESDEVEPFSTDETSESESPLISPAEVLDDGKSRDTEAESSGNRKSSTDEATKSESKSISPKEASNDGKTNGTDLEADDGETNSDYGDINDGEEKETHEGDTNDEEEEISEDHEWRTVPPSPVRIDSDKWEIVYDADDEADGETGHDTTLWRLPQLTVQGIDNRRLFLRQRFEDNQTKDPETRLNLDSATPAPTDEIPVEKLPDPALDTSTTQNIRPETPPAWWNKWVLKKSSSSSKTEVLATKPNKSTLRMDVPECSGGTESARPESPPAWWNFWSLKNRQWSVSKVHPAPRNATESDGIPTHSEEENPKEVTASLIEDGEGGLEVTADKVLANELKINIPQPPGNIEFDISEPLNDDLSSNSVNARTSETSDIEDRTRYAKLLRPPTSRRQGFSYPLRNEPSAKSVKIQKSSISEMKNRTDETTIPRPLSRKSGFYDISKHNIPQGQREPRKVLVPDRTLPRITDRDKPEKSGRKFLRNHKRGWSWYPGRPLPFDPRSISPAALERLNFIREDFELTPSQEKITDIVKFNEAKREYLRIKRGGKVIPLETLHRPELESKESHEDPALFGDDAWPLPTGEHIPPILSASITGNMSRWSFEQRLVPVLERDFGVAILEADPPPSKWTTFKNALKLGRKSSVEIIPSGFGVMFTDTLQPRQKSKPQVSGESIPSSCFRSMRQVISKKWTKITKKERVEEGVKAESELVSASEIDPEVVTAKERFDRAEEKREAQGSPIRVNSDLMGTKASRPRKPRKIEVEVKTSEMENSQGEKPDDNCNFRPRRHRKTSGKKSEVRASMTINAQGEEPENHNIRPRRHRNLRTHRRPD